MLDRASKIFHKEEWRLLLSSLLLSLLCPALLHCFSDTLTSFRSQLALSFGWGCCCGSSGASLGAAPTTARNRLGRIGKQSTGLLQFPYLRVDLGNNSSNFH